MNRESGYKLVCFDLDDTLIRDIHSVMLPCILNGKEEEHSVIQEKEEQGLMDYIVADHLRAELLEGLEESGIDQHFFEIARPLKHIHEVISLLHTHHIKCVLITVGPIQVARVAANYWGFDAFYGSDYEVVNGKFTGKILHYIKSEKKVEYLKDFCSRNSIQSEACIAVGDGSTDLPAFDYCGASIAINASKMVKERATYAVDTDDLMDIVSVMVSLKVFGMI